MDVMHRPGTESILTGRLIVPKGVRSPRWLGCRGLFVVWSFAVVLVFAADAPPAVPRVVSRMVAARQPALHEALYTDPTGLRLANAASVSDDNGQTWMAFQPSPDFSSQLPYGYRRERCTGVVDPRSGRLLVLFNALDTPGLDPAAVEPPVSLREYYLRYRVSADGGRTWLFDEPIIQAGPFTAKNPFEGVHLGKNGVFLGDVGCMPIVTRTGSILVPVQATMLGPDGRLWNPTGQTTFTDVFVLRGSWTAEGRIAWSASGRLRGDAARTTRGVIEPTLAQFPDGRILMVLRGSNAGNARLPSYRWLSVSRDDGATWTEPQPWTYDDGQPMFSPSSMSALAGHSSGRVFWVGNISPVNCSGNDPRFPVIFSEVEPSGLTLRRASLLEIDGKRPEDDARGRELVPQFNGKLDLSHFWLREDRATGEFVLTYPRAYGGYVRSDWATVRIAVVPAN